MLPCRRSHWWRPRAVSDATPRSSRRPRSADGHVFAVDARGRGQAHRNRDRRAAPDVNRACRECVPRGGHPKDPRTRVNSPQDEAARSVGAALVRRAVHLSDDHPARGAAVNACTTRPSICLSRVAAARGCGTTASARTTWIVPLGPSRAFRPCGASSSSSCWRAVVVRGSFRTRKSDVTVADVKTIRSPLACSARRASARVRPDSTAPTLARLPRSDSWRAPKPAARCPPHAPTTGWRSSRCQSIARPALGARQVLRSRADAAGRSWRWPPQLLRAA